MAVDHNNPQSRDEEILIATIDGTEYDKIPQSRMEELLLELKEVIEEGGGGGGTTNYNNLSNQPQVNGETLIGDKTGAELGLVDAEEGKGLSTNDYDDNEKAAVAAATSAISAMKDGVDIDSFGDVETALSAIEDGSEIDSFGDVEVALLDKADTSDLGTAAAKDSTNAVTSGSTDLVESGAVKDAIDAAVAAAYHHAGTKTVAQLTHDLLIAANEGNVYNITDSGTTTSDFIEGIGKQIDAGDNVGICKVGDVYMFDLLSGLEDTSIFVQKSQTAGLLKNDGTVNTTIESTVADHTTAISGIKDGQSIDSFADVESALSGKVDKVPGKGLSTNDYTTSEKNKLTGLEAYNGFAGQSICYFESSNPNVEIYITGAGTSIESALGSEDTSKNLYMIRFTADAPATLTGRLFEYDEEYPVAIMNPDLPITYFDGTPFTREIHAGDYIIIKLTAGPSSLTGGVIVADFDSTIRKDMTDVIGWDKRKNLYVGSPSFDGYSGGVWNVVGELHDGYPVIYRTGAWEGKYKEIQLDAGTYTFSVYAKGSNGAEAQLYIGTVGDSQIRKIINITSSWAKYSITFDLESQFTVTPKFELRTSGTEAYISEYQLEKGSTATAYEPYHEQVGVQARGLTDAIGWDNHKNLLSMTLNRLKTMNDGGTWNGNTYTYNGVSFTVNQDDNGNIISIVADGTATGSYSRFWIADDINLFEFNGYILSGCPTGGGELTYRFVSSKNVDPWTTYAIDDGNGATISSAPNTENGRVFFTVYQNVSVDNIVLKPMISKEGGAFQPYYPVLGPAVVDHESRIEEAESDINEINSNLTNLNIHRNFTSDTLVNTITELIAYVRDNLASGGSYKINGVFTVNQVDDVYVAIMAKASTKVYGMLNYGDKLYAINYVAGTYKNIMEFSGTKIS